MIKQCTFLRGFWVINLCLRLHYHPSIYRRSAGVKWLIIICHSVLFTGNCQEQDNESAHFHPLKRHTRGIWPVSVSTKTATMKARHQFFTSFKQWTRKIVRFVSQWESNVTKVWWWMLSGRDYLIHCSTGAAAGEIALKEKLSLSRWQLKLRQAWWLHIAWLLMFWAEPRHHQYYLQTCSLSTSVDCELHPKILCK